MILFISGCILACRVFTTVVNGIGPSFSPNRSPSITPPYLTEVRLVCQTSVLEKKRNDAFLSFKLETKVIYDFNVLTKIR